MTTERPCGPVRGSGLPTDCWYAAASSSDVGRALTAVRAVGRPVVLFRTTAGEAVALEDRCAHRAYPLSSGRLDGDVVRCGLCGFGYDTGGQCVSVPTQPRVPFGACVPAFPVRESDGLVWVWLGEPGRARLHRVPELGWLSGPGWASVGDEVTVAAGFGLLHENFADVTQVPFVAPEIAPSVLGSIPPELTVIVTETTVRLRREFPPAALPDWQSQMLGSGDQRFEHVQEGAFVSPALWVDHWDVRATGPTGAPVPGTDWQRLRFTHLVTPLDRVTTRVMWRVSRDFAVTDPAATTALQDVFGGYYERAFRAMAVAQQTLDVDGPGAEVNVSADVAGLKVREIIAQMLAEQSEVGRSRPRRA
jgi:phenylpropionate dioxygenase-like ring-hydroxylating dioxygenase large terminal subunit